MYKKRKAPVTSDPEKAYGAALRTAMNIVGYKDNTLNQLKTKLTERGYSETTVNDVCEYMTMKGYVNDTRMIFRSARSLALNKLYGKKRIMKELALKRFTDEAYDAFTFDSDELEDVDFTEVCLKLLKKKGGARDDKTFAFLIRYGHSVSDIKEAYKRLQTENEDE
ncbi:MAG: RecX family transcriptional regulator [Clostridia bacterium]|nr:RecX family transcriptional regulator [Clostridia bacterium]